MESPKIRVIFQQPSLAKYRLPVFQTLAARPAIALRLLYGQVPGLPNVAPEGFDATFIPAREVPLFHRKVRWHRAQWWSVSGREADVVVLSWDLHYASLLPALLRARIHGVGTLLWGHGYSKHEAAWRRWARQRVGRLATAVIFYNHTVAQQHIDAGWDPSRVFVALNSLDQRPIEQARQHWLERPAELEAFRRENQLGDGPLILFVSRLDPANRVDLLLSAAAGLRQQWPGLRIVIIGKGEDEPRLRKLARSLGLEDITVFPGAVYDEHQLAPWFLAADVFCYPANIGLSLLHAFGYGLPVVTSNRIAAQNPEVEALRDGENGLMYQDRDVPSLQAALARLLSDDQLRRGMSESALRTVREQFTLARMVDGFEAAIRYCARHRTSQ